MDILRSREKAKYSTFPGWHSSHIYQHNPSTAADLQHPAKYNSSTGETKTWMTSGTGTSWNIHDVNKQNEISTAKFPSQTDYTGKVRREKLRSNKGRYKETDIHEQRDGWDSTWPINCRGKREEKELQDYANFYHHTLSNKSPGFEVGKWRSGIEKVLGCGQWEQFQPAILTSHKRDQTHLSSREREQWRNWNSRNMESIFPVVSLRQPPSYTAPPAYSRPKDRDKRAGIPNATAQEPIETFRRQTCESRKVNFTDSTETRRNPSANIGHYLQKNNQQNTESYDLTSGQHGRQASVLQYTAIKTKPSSQAQLQSSEMTYPDISRIKQTKLARRKGGETVFCLVSRMGEVSGLSSSPEEPLKSHVLPLLTDPKPDDLTNTPNTQNQDEYLKDEAVRQLHGSFTSGEYGCTPQELTGGDQRSSSIPDCSNVIKPNENKQELQCYVQRNDSQSQKSYMETNRHEKPYKEILEKFPLWKEPKYQHHLMGMARQRNEQSQGINSIGTNTKDTNKSTKDRKKSLVVIDATRVVVKVELVLLPEKEHVQYVCLTEDSPLSSTREGTDELKQNRSVIASHENSTLDKREERTRGIPHEYPRTVLQTYESISHGSNLVDPVKEFEDSPSAAETVVDWQVLENEVMLGQPWSGTTLENNEGLEDTLGNQTTAKEPEFRTNAKTSEDSGVQTEKTTVQKNQATNQEKGPTLDDSEVQHRTNRDNENHQKDTSPKERNKYSPAEENLSDEIDDGEELVSDCSAPLPKTRAENAIREVQHGVVLYSSALRRSSSSPHLLFTTWDGPHTENEPSSTNTKGTQYSSLPSLTFTAFENSSLSKTRSMSAEVLLCTSSPPEHKQEIQHAMSLWDAVSRIRKHTAPDSETEEEEDTDVLYQTLNTEQ